GCFHGVGPFERQVLVGGESRLGSRQDGLAVDGRDVDGTVAAQGQRQRAANQSKSDDHNAFHPRIAWPMARSFSANATASLQLSVAGRRGISPALPIQVRRITPSAPAAM